ncbi:MAG TPA: HAD-IIB family hydrolase [bacterium]|nr:HAD-IIB family hydrolase [bacterium]
MRALDRAKPLAEISAETCRARSVIATDIDDTMTTHGKIPAATFDALWRAQAAGLKVIPVTGRPAGWCDHIARMWPVDGVVGENGGLWFRMTGGRMKRHWILDERARAENRRKLAAIGEEILREVKGAAISADQFSREFDLAIDFCEDVPPLPAKDVDRIVAIFEKHGCTAKVSSIHVNGWFGSYDKKSMLATMLASEFGIDAEKDRARILFAGDSPNDEPMFAHFPVSVGVANVREFADRITRPPAFIAARAGGEGFAEIVDTVLARRT